MKFKIFISYSTKDLALATRAQKMLQQMGYVAYVAEYNAAVGAVLTESIKQNIANSDLFLLLWSRAAKESEWVSQETGIATAQKKTIIPFILEEGLHPPGFIHDLKYIPAYKGMEVALDHLHSAVLKNASQKEKERGVLLIGLAALFLLAVGTKG